MSGRRNSAPGPGAGRTMAPIAAPRRRAHSADGRRAMPANLLSEIRQMGNARQTLAGHGGGSTIGLAARSIHAARAVTTQTGGNANGALNQNLVGAIGRRNLTLRDPGGLGGVTMLSPRNHRGVGLAVTNDGAGLNHVTNFLDRAGRTIQNLDRTNAGRTLLTGLDTETNNHAAQFHNSPGVTIRAMHPLAEGNGSSTDPRFENAGRGASVVAWDMSQQENAAWGQQTNDNVILGHEMIHAWRRTRGENYFTNPRGVGGPHDIQRMEELETSGLSPSPTPVTENRLRGALGARPRTDYEGLRPEPGYMEQGRRIASAMLEWQRGFREG